MKKLIAAAAGTVMLSGIAFAQAPQIMSSVPAQSVTKLTDWYKQSVYDPRTAKSARSWTCFSPQMEKLTR